MSVLIIGGDYIDDICKNFKQLGYHRVTHFKGRKKIKKRDINIPRETNLIIVLTDYINHNIAKGVKEKAKDKSIPIIFARRSWPCIKEKLCG